MKPSNQQVVAILPVVLLILIVFGTVTSDYRTLEAGISKELYSRAEGMMNRDDKTGRIDPNQVNEIINNMSKVLAMLYPGLVIIEFTLFTGLGVLLLSLIGIVPKKVRTSIRFSELRIPFYYVWILIATMGITVISLNMDSLFIKRLSLNYLLIHGAILMLQGIAVLRYIAVRIGMSTFTQILFIVTGILLFSQLFFPVLTAIGFFDLFFDLRTRFERKRKENGSA